MAETAYLNGEFLTPETACVPVMDRGFLFGDSCYEVIPVYDGQPFLLDAHLDRFARSLAALDIADPMSREVWNEVLGELVQRCGAGDALIYAQVTRGISAIRDHAAVSGLKPTVFAMAKPFPGMAAADIERGLTAITLEDIRWQRCDIKATTLLANVLARKQAASEGADEAILIRDGRVTEGAASNVFVVLNGLVVTPPKTNEILAGITRDFILELAAGDGIPYAEASVDAGDLEQAEEIWISSSSKEVMPVVRLNARLIGDGKPGAVWRRVRDLFSAHRSGTAFTEQTGS